MNFSGVCRWLVAAGLVCTLWGADEKLRSLNVAAFDGAGKPAVDLRAADWQVLVDGRPQPIAFIRFTGEKPKAAIEPGQVSNGEARPTTVVLLDLLNDRTLSGSEIVEETVRAVKNLESSAGVYVYLLTARGNLVAVHPLPQPDSEPAAGEEQWARNIGPMLQSALKGVIGLRHIEESDVTTRLNLTARAILEVAGQLKWISGRKSVVWVTHGVPLCGLATPQEDLPEAAARLRQNCGQLAQTQIALYPVMKWARGAAAAVGSDSEEALEEAASLTGGRKYMSGRLDDALQQAVSDSRANYEIVYEMQEEKADRRRHKVQVICTRKDVRLWTKSGFYGEEPTASPGLMRAGVEKVLHGPFDAAAIGMRGSVSPAGGSMQSLRIEVRVDPADLRLHAVQGGQAGKVSLWFAAMDGVGWTEPSSPGPVDVRLTREQYEKGLREGLEFHQALRVSAEVRRVRAIVVDEELGSIGSVTIPTSR